MTTHLRMDRTRPRHASALYQLARAYFASDPSRTLQTVPGLLSLLDAGPQLQPFMYSRGFVHRLAGSATGQP